MENNLEKAARIKNKEVRNTNNEKVGNKIKERSLWV